MSNTNDEIMLDCDECGAHEVIRPSELTDETHVLCPSCQFDYGTWGSIKMEITRRLKEFNQASFEETSEGLKNIKFTKSEGE
jgi:hypothetical protein